MLQNIKILKNKSIYDKDDMSAVLLKKCIHLLVAPVIFIVNNSLKYKKFSTENDIIVPLRKKNDSYRT